MDIRNRMADVDSLRCHACQDLLKMILQSKPGWQEKLLEETGEKYLAANEEMEIHGIESFSVDKMDISIIFEILKRRRIASVESSTFFALQQLKDDRNHYQGHPSFNEETDELYLRALLSLLNIKKLVYTVAEDENTLDKDERLAYKRKNICEAERLMALIDDERITFVQQRKAVMRDIEHIKESEDSNTWIDIYGSYLKRWQIDRMDKYFMFISLASDAGIKNAHEPALAAAIYNKDWEEYDRRLPLVYHDCYLLREDWGSAKEKAHMLIKIMSMINEYISTNKKESPGIKLIIEGLSKSGIKISKTGTGLYELIKD